MVQWSSIFESVRQDNCTCMIYWYFLLRPLLLSYPTYIRRESFFWGGCGMSWDEAYCLLLLSSNKLINKLDLQVHYDIESSET